MRAENPVGKISRTAWMDAPETLKVMMALCGEAQDHGDEARFVGGCVRDAVLNKISMDIDIATIHKPEDIILRLEKNGIQAIPTGIDHGTVTAVIDGKAFEITTLRRDVETDGRHAVVAFTDSWHKDAGRRDFTMNALYANIRGELYDYFGGLADAKAGRVVFIRDPQARIAEDYLRILRYYRFCAHYAQLDETDQNVRQACKDAAAYLKNISAERIRTEILKLIIADKAAAVWQMMIEDQIIDIILPQLVDVKTLAALIELEKMCDVSPYDIRRLASLVVLSADSNGAVQCLTKSMALSNDQSQMLHYLCRDEIFTSLPDDKKLRLLIYTEGRDKLRGLLLLFAARRAIPPNNIIEILERIKKIQTPQFMINGQDLIERGVTPGPDFGRILRELEQWWMDQDFTPGRTACLEKLDALI